MEVFCKTGFEPGVEETLTVLTTEVVSDRLDTRTFQTAERNQN